MGVVGISTSSVRLLDADTTVGRRNLQTKFQPRKRDAAREVSAATPNGGNRRLGAGSAREGQVTAGRSLGWRVIAGGRSAPASWFGLRGLDLPVEG